MNKFLRLLLHPLTLSAVGLMLFNDLVLKHLWPNTWATNKLSDLAWLFFVPYLVGMVLEWGIPISWKRRDVLIAGLAFGGVGGIFCLAKTDAAFNHWLIGIARDWTGWRLKVALDPEDLVTLPALLASFWLWRRGVGAKRPSLQWAVVPLILLVTLADAAAPDYGVSCLKVQGEKVLARADYNQVYASVDGGSTWQPLTMDAQSVCEGLISDEPILLQGVSETQYRIIPGKSLDISTDGGLTWDVKLFPENYVEAERAYETITRPGNLSFSPGPLDGVVDPNSGRIMMAMGQEGVLSYSPDGTWTWADVGQYRHASLQKDGLPGYLLLLGLRLLLAGIVWLSWVNTRTVLLERTRWRIFRVIVGWLGLLAAMLLSEPSLASSGYIAPFSILTAYIALGWVGVSSLIDLIHYPDGGVIGFLRQLPGGLLVALVFLVPYILWAFNVIASYWIASLIALLIPAGAVWAVGRRGISPKSV